MDGKRLLSGSMIFCQNYLGEAMRTGDGGTKILILQLESVIHFKNSSFLQILIGQLTYFRGRKIVARWSGDQTGAKK